MRKVFLSFLLSMLFLFPNIVHSVHHEDFQSQKHFEKLYNLGDSSVRMEKGQLYLNFNRLFFNEEGIFLETDTGEYYPIQNVTYDGFGYRISGCTHYVCSMCGTVYKDRPGSCSKYIESQKRVCGNRIFFERWNT